MERAAKKSKTRVFPSALAALVPQSLDMATWVCEKYIHPRTLAEILEINPTFIPLRKFSKTYLRRLHTIQRLLKMSAVFGKENEENCRKMFKEWRFDEDFDLIASIVDKPWFWGLVPSNITHRIRGSIVILCQYGYLRTLKVKYDLSATSFVARDMQAIDLFVAKFNDQLLSFKSARKLTKIFDAFAYKINQE